MGTLARVEVMGLLLGDIEASADRGSIARVWRLSFQKRVDRRADRVEISPEQLAAASEEAARHTTSSGVTTRVIGWYHSHPHITVLPSHVDVQTQGQYQLLDTGFIGLIFSVFSNQADCTSRMQMVAFQAASSGSGFEQQLVPRVQLEEEREAYAASLSALQQLVKSAESGGQGLAAAHSMEIGIAFNSSVYQKTLCSMLTESLPPLAQTLEDAKQNAARNIAALEAQLQSLEDHDLLARLEAQTQS